MFSPRDDGSGLTTCYVFVCFILFISKSISALFVSMISSFLSAVSTLCESGSFCCCCLFCFCETYKLTLHYNMNLAIDWLLHVKNKAITNRAQWTGPRVSELVGALSPVNHRGLHQGWKQTSIHLLVILHKSRQTAKFFEINKISFDTNITKLKFSRKQSIRYHPCHKKHIRLGHAGVVDFRQIYRYQIITQKNGQKQLKKTI